MPRDLIRACVEAARLAPSAENVQPWRFVAIDDSDTRDAFAKAAFGGLYAHTRWASGAPVLIAVCAELDVLANRIGKAIQNMPYYLIDVGIAGEQLVLQAEAMGLGSCWIGWFDYRKAKRFLGIPRRVRLCALIALGYPEKRSGRPPKKRKAVDELIRYNRW